MASSCVQSTSGATSTRATQWPACVEALAGLAPVNLGALVDVERWRPAERAGMLEEAAGLTELAVSIGAAYVQVLTGPVQPGGSYSGPADLTHAERREVTASALRSVADLGRAHGVRYYLEPIAWTPLASLADAVEAVDAAGCDNVGLVLDFWHLWQAGTKPDEIAQLDPRLIYGVDFANSLGPSGQPDASQASRMVWPGEGQIPLREWVAAVKATGFDGWWDNELYSPRHWELGDPFAVARELLDVLREMVGT